MDARLQLSSSSDQEMLSNTIDDDPNGLYQSERLSSQTQDINPNESQMQDINSNVSINPNESSQKKRSWKDSHSDPRKLRKKTNVNYSKDQNENDSSSREVSSGPCTSEED